MATSKCTATFYDRLLAHMPASMLHILTEKYSWATSRHVNERCFEDWALPSLAILPNLSQFRNILQAHSALNADRGMRE